MCIKKITFNASPVWFPSFCCIRKLGNFDRKCLKWVIGSMPYKDQIFLPKTLPIYYPLIINNVILFYKMLHGLTELPFSAYFFFKVTTSRKTTIISTIQTAKKRQTEKFFFNRVDKSVNELIRLGVDIFAPLESFKMRVKELLLERTVSTCDQLNSFSWFLRCTCSNCRSGLYVFDFFCPNLFKGMNSFIIIITIKASERNSNT